MTIENTPEPVPQDPRARVLTLTQGDLDELIRSRTERYRRQLTEAREDADRWRTRAKGNLAVADELRRMYGDLLARMGAPTPAGTPAPAPRAEDEL